MNSKTNLTVSNCKVPRWDFAINKANEILVSSKTITTFPFSATKLVKEFSGIKLCSFDKAYSKYNFKASDIGSSSAFLANMGENSILFYNNNESKARVKFDIIHEFGHSILDHKKDCDAQLYKTQEIETNFFAAQILMPYQILNRLLAQGANLNIDFLVKVFGVSKEAAQKRIHYLSKTYEFSKTRNEFESFDDIVCCKYHDFIVHASSQTEFSQNYDNDYYMDLERMNWF